MNFFAKCKNKKTCYPLLLQTPQNVLELNYMEVAEGEWLAISSEIGWAYLEIQCVF